MEDRLKSKIEGLIKLMNQGIYEGERSAARKALQRLCDRYDLNLSDMNARLEDDYTEEFSIKCKTILEASMLTQIIYKYAKPKGIYTRWRNERILYVECKPTKYIEALAAWEVLRPAYGRERRKIINSIERAFMLRHNLLSDRAPNEEELILSKEELDRIETEESLAQNMKSIQINKLLTSPKISN